ncbi:hypothetical protein SDC9_159615 [bioreactor metagenome]|uniref:Uncharacterized protein n=1 Tax=bioreactor metagenome TaxID=1076179 RepID=A0A645FG22_9ZZZZ
MQEKSLLYHPNLMLKLFVAEPRALAREQGGMQTQQCCRNGRGTGGISHPHLPESYGITPFRTGTKHSISPLLNRLPAGTLFKGRGSEKVLAAKGNFCIHYLVGGTKPMIHPHINDCEVYLVEGRKQGTSAPTVCKIDALLPCDFLCAVGHPFADNPVVGCKEQESELLKLVGTHEAKLNGKRPKAAQAVRGHSL